MKKRLRGGFYERTGQRFREARVARGFSQEEVAWAADVSQSSLSKYETGCSEMTMLTFIRICSALGLSPADVIPMTEASSEDSAGRATSQTAF